jgi:hypothetical protein
MTRRRLFSLFGVGAAAAAGVTLASVYGGARRPPTRAISTDQLTVDVEDTAPLAGVLSIRAKAMVGPLVMDSVCFWFVEVWRIDETTGHETRVLVRDYDHQPFPLPGGQRVRPTFADRIEAAAGLYSVLVGIREQRPVGDSDGNVVEPHRTIVGRSRLLKVL